MTWVQSNAVRQRRWRPGKRTINWYWPEYIQGRTKPRKKLSFVCMVTGRPGKGKSTFGQALATLSDPTFVPTIKEKGIRSRIAGKLSELSAMIKNENAKPGEAYILEEGGVNASSKKTMTTAVQAYEVILQVARYKRLIVIINAPYTNLYSKVGRNLLDAEFKILYRIGTWNVALATQCDYNSKLDKVFTPYLKLSEEFGKRPIKKLWLPLPAQVVIDEYSKLEHDIKQSMIDNAHESILRSESAEGIKSEKKVDTECTKCGLKWKRRSLNLPVTCPNPSCHAKHDLLRQLVS